MAKDETIEERQVDRAGDEWKKQEGVGIWTPEQEGDTLIGIVEAVRDSDYGKQYTVLKEDRTRVMTPSHKVLQSRMVEVEKGDMVKLVYLREEAPSVKGHHPTKMYDVFVKKMGD